MDKPGQPRPEFYKQCQCIEHLFAPMQDWRGSINRYERCSKLLLSDGCIATIIIVRL